MEENNPFDNFLRNLFYFLTEKETAYEDANVFRKHNSKLDLNGDLSFPLNYKAWKKYIKEDKDNISPIVKYIRMKSNDPEIFDGLLRSSKNWSFPLIECRIKLEKLNLFFNRSLVFKTCIARITSERENYGKINLSHKLRFELYIENEENDLSEIDLSQLRIILLKNVLKNLLDVTGNDISSNSSEIIYLTSKSESQIRSKEIVCGIVTSTKSGNKYKNIKALELYEKRTTDMQLLAQHKYRVRINSDSGWKEFLQHLGKAAVAIDMLYVKPNRPIVINIDKPTASHSKGAPFILYNCARLSVILKQFEVKVTTKIYPPLPKLDEIDFSLLNQPEEWEILYVYLVQYPQLIKSTIEGIMDCKISVHKLCTFLDSLCLLFSVYYRRVRILTDPRIHLFPVLHARIYLLMAIQEVFHNILALLNIPPVKQM